MIQLDDVAKHYPGHGAPVRAVDGVSLHVPRGQYVALCGPSGCGKSTLLALVAGLILPTQGRVVVAGNDFSAWTAPRRAEFRALQVGFVFQMFHLLPYLSVLENVLAAAGPDDRAAAAARAGELLERFGLGPRLSHKPGELSAGERQRTAMARALLNDPPLLLADEPTGNLDPASGAAVLDLLDEYHRQGGTLLLVTHDPQAAARAQRVVKLAAGKIVE